jgi:glycosyltransferase involved in cell wall biosynthesis
MTGPRLCFVGWADHVHVERWAGYFGARDPASVSVVSFAGLGRYPVGVTQQRLGLAGRGPRWHRWRLRYLFWRLRPELVHVHWAHFATRVHEVWKGPLVVTAWGSDIYRRDRFSDDEWSGLRTALRAADLITCDSDDLATTLRREFGLPPERVEVIQWGVDTQLFKPEGPNLRATLGLQGREVVLSARNFTPLYNQETVVQAFALLHARRPSAYLLMKSYGGDPDYLESIRALIARLSLGPHVRVLDSMPYEQMPDLYRTADVTLSIPNSDATPMALLEAMASGSTCVVGDLPSLREWVEPAKTGLLVGSIDATAVAAALEEALFSPARAGAMREAARALVIERASQHAHMGRMLARYEALGRSR